MSFFYLKSQKTRIEQEKTAYLWKIARCHARISGKMRNGESITEAQDIKKYGKRIKNLY